MFEDKVKEAIKYLDTLTFVPGDSPSLHFCWFRPGNNRRKILEKNNSPRFKFNCQVYIAEYVEPPKYNMEFKYFTSCSESPEEALDDIIRQVKSYEKEKNG